jgi:integrase
MLGWKQRLRHLPGGRERADYFTHLMTARSFYLDIAEWALSDPARWARWVSPPPVSAGETAGAKKLTRRRQAAMHQRTRTLAPVLPQLVRSVSAHRTWATVMLAAAGAVPEGDTFEVDGITYRRVVVKTAYGDHSRPSAQTLDGGRVLRLHRIEEVAFWAWAVVEVLRLTGIRLEEMLELTHLSIRRYVAPTGELTPLLQIAPSKADRERVLPALPELVAVLAEIIRRCRGSAETLPLLSRYDPLERTWGPRLPHLFQPNFGGPPKVLTAATVRTLLIEATERIQVTDVDGSPLRFTPHDMRRIFASDVVNSGLPIHIAQQLLGHLDLNTTQGYVAVYPTEIIRHYRNFIDRRRGTRPSEEYREPTAEEWTEFQEHFSMRRVALGTCHRPYGTPCVHEHACVRCPMLRVEPSQKPRLLQIETNTVERLDEARKMAWLGEVAALEESLRHIRDKREQLERSPIGSRDPL